MLSQPFHSARIMLFCSLLLEGDRGVADRLNQRESSPAESEALAGAEHHIARVVLLGDPYRAAVRGNGAACAFAYAQILSSWQVDRHAGSRRVTRKGMNASMPSGTPL